jgi:lysophospholipase L1-like esterase
VAANTKPDPRPGIVKNLAFSLGCMIGFLLIVETVMQLAGLAAARFNKPKLRPGAEVIVCIGDSHTYGVMVGKDQTYPAQLEKLLIKNGGNFQVLNLGAPGQNTTQIVNALPGIIKLYKPRAVLVLAGVNNGWNISGQEQGLFKNILSGSKIYKLSRFVYFHEFEPQKSFLVERRREGGEIVYNTQRDHGPKNDSELLATNKNIFQDLEQIVLVCRDNNVKIVLINYAGDKQSDYFVPNLLIQRAARELHVPLSDNYTLFTSRLYGPDGGLDRELHQELFFEDMHLKPMGYFWMAQNIYQLMEKEHIAK